MDLYNPHSLLDEAVEEHKPPVTATEEVVLSKLMIATPSCPDDMDLEKVVVTVVLFLASFFILAPRAPRRLKRRVDSKERIQVQCPPCKREASCSETSSTSPPATLCTGMCLQDDEETEDEHFEQMWPVIRRSPYRRLVLPPECKLVDKPTRIQAQKKIRDREKKKAVTELDDDHPFRRLQFYSEQMLKLIRSILSFDYFNALSTVIQWLSACVRLRHRHHQGGTEEEDDDASVQTSASASKQPASPQCHTPIATDTPYSSPGGEEKKDEPMLYRERSDGSVYDVPLNDDVGENDVQLQPPPIQRLSAKHAKNAKRKDALENYRGPLSSFHGQLPLAPKSNGQVTFNVTDDVPELHVRDVDAPQCQAIDDESEHSMSYFDATHSRDVMKRMSVVVSLPDKNGYILGDDFLPNSRHTPLLVFVNSRAGPQQGQLLITQLRRLLNPIQVWDLADGGPETILESFLSLSRLRILVCGGDGTVSWIISALEKMKVERWPPMAILPLGTGNDLARIHGWGGGYMNESLITILEQMAEAYISLLDRWEMKVEDKKGKIKEGKAFTNYLGVGADAQAALQVHMLRESMPKFFFSRAVNKAWYALFGAEDTIKATHANLPHEVTLIADGVEVPLPEDSQGIILLNIDSYAGGIPMWSHATKSGSGRGYGDMFYMGPDGQGNLQHQRSLSLDDSSYEKSSSKPFCRSDSSEDLAAAASLLTDEEKLASVTACDMPSSCQDGMLDIVSIRGAFHLGQIRVGLSHAKRLCQCREATVIIKRKTAVHIDGEPWRQTVATLHIKRKKEPAIMLHRSADESGGVETEMAKLLDWAEERQIIDRNVHATLMKEFSRRIECKTRQRRVRSQDNLMLTLSRAIGRTNSFPSQNQASPFPNSITF